MKRLLKKIYIMGCFLIFFAHSTTTSAFVAKKIQVEGLQRIRLETVLNYLPIEEGQDLKEGDSANIIDSLYHTDFFEDIHLYRENNTLVIVVVERPVITSVSFSGNKIIKKEKFEEVLKEQGVTEGAIYDEAKLAGILHALEAQYEAQGRFNATVDLKVDDKPRNRVAINIIINEGTAAKVKKIRFFGNNTYSQKTLANQFKLTVSKPWSKLFHNDIYSRDRLNQDLNSLSDFYMNKGHLKFRILSDNVKMSDDQRFVYINIYLEEGPVYKFSSYNIEGDLILPKSKVEKVIHIKKGDTFSRKLMMQAHNTITEIYANEGYAMVRIDVIPKINDKSHTVDITFKITPGTPTYVRNIEFIGNTRTQDDVLRREMRQFEGALYSKSKVLESKRRINNLGYLEKVEANTKPVPGHSDQVDVEYIVSEASTASARAQVGYSDAVGFLYGASLNQKNFMGTGRSVGLNFEKNDAYRTYKFSYFNPYYTISGIGRGFSAFSTRTTPGRVGISAYTTDSHGGSMNFSLPVSKYNHVSTGLGYTHIKIYTGDKVSDEIRDFISMNGNEYDEIIWSLGWTHSTYDRAIYPTSGFKHSLSGVLSLPVTTNSLDYYKITYIASYYKPLCYDFILHFRTKLGYGDSYGRTETFPFFLNYYAGGIDTVRGLDDNSLGPRDSNDGALGGNIITTGSLEIVFPNPLGDRVRTRAFVDVGNVFQNNFDIGELHITSGLQVDWISPFGPLQLSLGYPLNNIQNQKRKALQFSLGASF